MSLNELILKGEPLSYIPNESLGNYAITRLKENGDNVFQIISPSGESNTFRDVLVRSVSVAIEMKRRGIGKGDVVTICTYNHLDSCVPLLAALYIGAVASPIHPTHILSEFKHFLNISKPKLIFCESFTSEILDTAATELNLKVDIVEFDQTDDDEYIPYAYFLLHTDAESVNNFEPVNFHNPYDHLAVIMTSSGTTGLPKMVAISHGSIMHGVYSLPSPTGIDGFSYLNVSYLSWITEILFIFFGIDKNVHRIIIYDFDPELVLETLERFKIFLLLMGVSQLRSVIRYEQSMCETRSLKYPMILSIPGSRASEDLISDAKKIFETALFYSSYSTTEFVGVPFSVIGEKPNLSMGSLTPGTLAKIINPETNEILGPNKKGELCLKSRTIMMGYYNNPEATTKTIDEDGFLHTADLCYYDENKFFFFDTRICEVFKYCGWVITAQEMEDALKEHPDIYDAAVVGVPHPEDQNRAMAFIVKKSDSKLTEYDIHVFMKERMNPFKQLRGGVVFLDEMPLTPSGKVNKKKIHEMVKSIL